MVTKEELLAIKSIIDQTSQYAYAIGCYFCDGEISDPVAVEATSDNTDQLSFAVKDIAEKAVAFNQGALNYDMSEKITYTYMKMLNELSLQNHKDLWEKIKVGEEVYEEDVYAASSKAKLESRAHLIAEASENGFSDKQATLFFKAYDTLAL